MEPQPSAHADETELESAKKDLGDITSTWSSLNRLIEAAARTGRDWKLVDAVLQTITDFIREPLGNGPVPEQQLVGGDVCSTNSVTPAWKPRLEAVVDSFSDDEASRCLDVGLRHLRRLAQYGRICSFKVGKRRRYPMWQFADRTGLLPGVPVVVAAIPKNWSPETTHAFMTTPALGLVRGVEQLSPIEWLRAVGDPSMVVVQMQKQSGINAR
ncbi:helix-turn-helix domain-containing protein [Plantibacter sp. ME-Dv--P-095]|uniref:helix-turn-helix domain-containing protein n=1 Tax=Plantibacter sp. ME-Dv--P-095 TaxID=3040299 RepID=UPI00254D4CAF|nr:helix-turn-helix domain-containing protein [Plantibacter sp. ME-Dv--P-095]